jgi:hypothetical protein
MPRAGQRFDPRIEPGARHDNPLSGARFTQVHSTPRIHSRVHRPRPRPSAPGGYYLVGADGGVFALGDAQYQGSMGNTKLNRPVQSIVADPDGEGY